MGEPVQRTTDGHEEHEEADRHPAAVYDVSANALGDDDRGHRFERLHGHRQAVHETGRYLQRAESHKYAGRIEMRRGDHPDNQRERRAQVTERA